MLILQKHPTLFSHNVKPGTNGSSIISSKVSKVKQRALTSVMNYSQARILADDPSSLPFKKALTKEENSANMSKSWSFIITSKVSKTAQPPLGQQPA